MDISPEEQRLAEQGRAAIAAAVASTHAPLALRERIEADHARQGRTRRRWAVLAPIAAVATLAAVVVLGLSLGGGDGVGGGGRAGGPTVLALAGLAARPLVEPAPKPDPAHPGFLKVKVDKLSFPTYVDANWRAAGARRDRVAGAPARTVHYHGRDGAQAAYTIARGTGLPSPPGARTVSFHGKEYKVANVGSRVVVSWELMGHTCVLSAPASVGGEKLLGLALWRP